MECLKSIQFVNYTTKKKRSDTYTYLFKTNGTNLSSKKPDQSNLIKWKFWYAAEVFVGRKCFFLNKHHTMIEKFSKTFISISNTHTYTYKSLNAIFTVNKIT